MGRFVIGMMMVGLGLAPSAAAPPIVPSERERAAQAEGAGRYRGIWSGTEIIRRGYELERVNEGLQGRINATRDAVEQAEVPNRAADFRRRW
jgi:hypothetical protein